MPRIEPVSPEAAEGKSKELLDAVQSKLGMVPNLLKTFAHSPATLQSYLSLSENFSQGVLDAKQREQIALAVAQTNECGYCLSAHTAIGKGAGLSDEDIKAARLGSASDAKTDALVKFANVLVDKRGFVSDEDLGAVRNAGASEAEIVETVGNTVFNFLTNYTNHVAKTEIDFPKAEGVA